VVHNLFAKDGNRKELFEGLCKFSEETWSSGGVQICAVLEEINDITLVALRVR
jgi:hypothetical protein